MSEHTKPVPPLANPPQMSRRFRFEHHGLDAFDVALEALVQGDAIIKGLPRGYGTLADQLRRALQGAFLQTTEAAARSGEERQSRFRCARAEAGEAAGALEAIARLGLAGQTEVDAVLELLWRLCAMLHQLGRARR